MGRHQPNTPLPHGRDVAEPALLNSHSQGWLTCSPSIRANITVLPRQGTGSPFLSVSTCWGQSQLTHSHDPGASSPTTLVGKGQVGEAITLTPMPPHGRGVVGPGLLCSLPQGWLTHTLCHRDQLYCVACARYRAHPLSKVMLVVRDGSSSSEHHSQ